MCGIVGLLNLKDTRENVNKKILNMMHLIKHRGPNDSGLYGDSIYPFSMGMTRLSIMDLDYGVLVRDTGFSRGSLQAFNRC